MFRHGSPTSILSTQALPYLAGLAHQEQGLQAALDEAALLQLAEQLPEAGMQSDHPAEQSIQLLRHLSQRLCT